VGEKAKHKGWGDNELRSRKKSRFGASGGAKKTSAVTRPREASRVPTKSNEKPALRSKPGDSGSYSQGLRHEVKSSHPNCLEQVCLESQKPRCEPRGKKEGGGSEGRKEKKGEGRINTVVTVV